MSKAPVEPTRITIRDVADHAGVSIATVSQAFGGGRPVAERTRAKVLEAAAELGYRADPSARSLRTGRSSILGVILRPRDAARGSIHGAETFPRFTGAVATDALDRGLGLVHVPDIFEPTAARVPMDGCIVAFPYAEDDVVNELLRRGIAVVLADADPERPDFTWAVALDHEPAVTDLLDRLSAQGARRVEFVSGAEDNSWNRTSREAYLAWTSRAQMPARTYELFEGAGPDGACELGATILRQQDPPDAIVAATSRFAVGIAQAVTETGLSIPDDVMLAALTDDLAQTRAHDPPITAVDLRLEDLAHQAIELLVDQIEGAETPSEPVRLRPSLHWRLSTERRTGRRS